MHACEYASGEVTSHRDKIDVSDRGALKQFQIPAYFFKVLMLKYFIYGYIVVAPAEVGAWTGLYPCACRTGDGGDVDLCSQQSRIRKREQCKLDCRGETSRIGKKGSLADSVPLQLRKSIYITFAFVPKILGEVYHLQFFRTPVHVPELPALAVG